MTNYLRLVAYQERLGVRGNPNIYLVLEATAPFSGLREIADRLPDRISERLAHGKPAAEHDRSDPLDERSALRISDRQKT